MSKLLDLVARLIPAQYSIKVGIKKGAYMLGKLTAGFITAKLVTTGKLSAEQCSQIEVAVTAIAAGGLELAHDWARMKFPDNKWL